jgi:hypothetical protein
MKEIKDGRPVPPNSHVVLEDGKQILLSSEDGGRLVHVQMLRV